MTSSPIVFTIVASEGSVASTVSTKRSIMSSASSSPSSSVYRVKPVRSTKQKVIETRANPRPAPPMSASMCPTTSCSM